MYHLMQNFPHVCHYSVQLPHGRVPLNPRTTGASSPNSHQHSGTMIKIILMIQINYILFWTYTSSHTFFQNNCPHIHHILDELEYYPWPKMVTFWGSPPKEFMFLCTHSRATLWSNKPCRTQFKMFLYTLSEHRYTERCKFVRAVC